MIGAQSSTLPLVAAAGFVPGASLLSSHLPVVGNPLEDKSLIQPAIINTEKQSAIRGTLE